MNALVNETLQSELLISTLKLSGPILFVSLLFSSLYTASFVKRSMTTGHLSPIPNVSLLTNCVVWTLYGLFKNDGTIFIPNGIGTLVSVYCIYIFHLYAQVKPKVIYFISIMIISFVAILAYLNEYFWVGFTGCLVSVMMTASPLVVIKTVILQKSTASLPLATTVVIFFNALSWSLYGLLVAHDQMVYGPNIFGFLLACIQVSLFFIYGLPPTDNSNEVIMKNEV